MSRCGIVCSLIVAWLVGQVALGAEPRVAVVASTQRAVVYAEAFAADDPVMKSPQAAKALSATIVSANFSKTPAMQAFAELAKQSGYRIELSDAGGQTRFGNVTVSISKQPFWSAMREVCTRGNVNLYYYGDGERDRIPIMPSNYGNPGGMKAAASIMGPFMTFVTNIQRENTVLLNNPASVDRKVQVQIYTFAEPKAAPVQYQYEPEVIEAIDDNGNSMMPTTPRDSDRRNMQGSRGIAWHGHMSLPYPQTNPGKRIARLRGRQTAMVQLGSEPFEIADPLKAAEVTKTIGGQRITFRSFKQREKGQYELELVYHRDGADPQLFNGHYSTTPDLKLLDAKGGQFQFRTSRTQGTGEEITRGFIFFRRPIDASAPEPVKLIIQVPTATQEIAIPFELVDLPMP